MRLWISARARGAVATACAVGLFVPVSAGAAELHVGAGQPYATVQEAADAAAPGDVVAVHGGSYPEPLDLDGSGTENQRIRIEPAGDGAVTLTGRVRIHGDYWDLADFAIVGVVGTDAVGIDGSYNRLLRLELSGGDRDGVDGAGVGNELRELLVHDFDAGQSDAHCVVLNPGAQDWVIADSELRDCSGDSIQLYAAAAERTIVNTRIERNHLHYTGAIGRMENAVDVKNADGLVIYGNVMHGFPDNKVMVFQKGPANVTVECNVMYDGFTGVEFRAEDGGTVENVSFERNLMHDFSEYALKFDGTVAATVLHNTFVDVGSDGLRIEGAGLGGAAAANVVRNNLWLRSGAIDAGTLTADHNAFFQTGAVGIASASDVTSDPMLDPDHRLTAQSPLVDAGVDVGAPFAGDAPDIGWHELGLDGTCDVAPAGSGGGGGGAEGGGAGGTGGLGGGAEGGGAGGTGGLGTSGDSAAVGDDGCGCRATGHAPWGSGRGGWLVLALAAMARVRRRRSHSCA